MIYTVFAKNELPQDFPTYFEAKEYGDKEFGKDYVIERTSGECE